MHVPTDHGSQCAMRGTTWMVSVSVPAPVPASVSVPVPVPVSVSVPVSEAVSMSAVPKPIAVV